MTQYWRVHETTLEKEVSTNIYCGKSLMSKKKRKKKKAKKALIKQNREAERKPPGEGKGQFPIITTEFVGSLFYSWGDVFPEL